MEDSGVILCWKTILISNVITQLFYIIFLGLVFWKARKVFVIPAPVKKEINVVNLLHAFLQCIICKEISHAPIIVASCCESIIGCQQCVKGWIDSGKNTCPKCREEGFNCATINLRGLDDFLGKIQ